MQKKPKAKKPVPRRRWKKRQDTPTFDDEDQIIGPGNAEKDKK